MNVFFLFSCIAISNVRFTNVRNTMDPLLGISVQYTIDSLGFKSLKNSAFTIKVSGYTFLFVAISIKLQPESKCFFWSLSDSIL